MRLLEEDMSQELSWWILNQELWTQSELDLLVSFSDQTTLCLVKPEQETTGLKVITLKELNLLTLFLMLLEKKLKVVIVYKDSK